MRQGAEKNSNSDRVTIRINILPLHNLFYCSLAKEHISKDDILDILKCSRRNNEKIAITGILVYWKKTNQFLQLLEGEENVVLNLYDKICIDNRHSLSRIIYQENILERGFKVWTMAFKSIEEIDTTGIDGFSEFSKLGFTNERTKVSPSIAINLIQSFKDSLP
jgi:hypothetical protein